MHETPGAQKLSNAELGSFRPFNPEDSSTFRLARLLLLLHVAHISGRQVQSIDRLGYYEFFADNPFLVITEGGRRDEADGAALRAAGFSSVQLSYASSGHRFASRRRRLQHDLAQLIAYGLVELSGDGYVVTDAGVGLAQCLNSVYADAYRVSATLVLARLGGKSNKGLDASAEEWLGHSSLLIDILDDIRDAEAPQAEAARIQPSRHPEESDTQ